MELTCDEPFEMSNWRWECESEWFYRVEREYPPTIENQMENDMETLGPGRLKVLELTTTPRQADSIQAVVVFEGNTSTLNPKP